MQRPNWYTKLPLVQDGTDGLWSFLSRPHGVCCHVCVVCPCAVRYVVTEEVVREVFGPADGPKVLVCGANNPYGVLTPEGTLVEDK